ncbi:MAG: hypothetical protein HQ527_03820 [Cyanobacteria bacterium]|nr:hypothetical protein [Cyanobacteria bacterium bin.51]
MALLVLFGQVPVVAAAEVLQVRGANLLQVGDQNRSYPVRLGCIAIDPADSQAAADWLRQRLPRRTRVNLRPLGSESGVLISQVTLLSSGDDLGSGLVGAGLARRLPADAAPLACPDHSPADLTTQTRQG